jgi:hypothetical protein
VHTRASPLSPVAAVTFDAVTEFIIVSFKSASFVDVANVHASAACGKVPAS